MPEYSEHTVTDPDELIAELEAIRERDIAFNEEETTIGMRSVAAPVLQDGHPVGPS